MTQSTLLSWQDVIKMKKQFYYFIIFHPNFRHSGRVLPVTVVRNKVGVGRPEDVADVAARNRFHPAAAHPNPERKLQIFAAPPDHACVVGSNIKEEFPVDAKKSSGHRWGRSRIAGLAVGRRIVVRLPREVSRPVQTKQFIFSIIIFSRFSNSPWQIRRFFFLDFILHNM